MQIDAIESDGTHLSSTSTATTNVCSRLMRRFIDWIIRQLINGYHFISNPFKDFFAQVQRASKRDNSNRTPGEGTCYDLGKFEFEFEFRLSL